MSGADRVRPASSVLVVGAGVIGLTAAVRLLDAGHAVRVWTADDPLDTTSRVAGAVCYPYRVSPPEQALAWGQRSAQVFAGLARDPATGVLLLSGLELLRRVQPDPWWRAAVNGFGAAVPGELPEGYAAGWRFTTPVVAMDRYLPWLLERVEEAGGRIERRTVDHPEDVAGQADVVVGCLGVGARRLHGDASVEPVRGQVVLVDNPGLDRFVLDQEHPEGPTYVIPRGQDCVLGGTAEPGVWDTEPDPRTAARIRERCAALVPALRTAAVREHRVGLRPTRPRIRLEADTIAGQAWVHAYGHGGAGVTLSWGCAEAITALTATITGVADRSG